MIKTVSVIYFIIIICLLVLVHEGGHFLAAKAFNVKVNDFSIGMGPCLFKKQGKETLYSIRLFPIGGYVKMEGEDEESDNPRAFVNLAPYKKFIIVAAGAVLNLLLGFIVMLGITIFSPNVASTQIGGFTDNAISNTCGLQVNDTIKKIDNTKINTYSDISFTLTLAGKEAVDVTVLRDGKEVVLENVKFPKLTVDKKGNLLGLDIDFLVYRAKKTPLFVIKEGFYSTVAIVKTVYVSFVKMFTGAIGFENMSGPVGITQAVGQAAKYGWLSLLNLFAFITVNLGVVNLLPLPALDGGRLVFILIELIIRRPVPQKYEGAIHFVGLAALMLLLVVITFNDIVRLFG